VQMAMRDLRANTVQYIEHLREFLEEIKKKKPIKHNFSWIIKSGCWTKFKQTMLKTDHTFLVP